jgi:hypothetical protein
MTSVAAPTGTTARRGRALRVSPVQTGIVAALLAVTAGTWFEVGPPDAYGICMACHARDLVNWSINGILHTELTVAPASLVIPVLTPIGVLVGAGVAAVTSGEFRWHVPDHPARSFAYGVLVMNLALLAGGCSIRLLLRASAGEPGGVIGVGGLISGVVAGTAALRWWARR